MNRRNFVASMLAAAAIITQPLAADTTRITESLMLEYVDWITDNSEFEYSGEALPEITFRTTVELQQMQYGAERWEELAATGLDLPEIVALFDRHENRILFNTGIDFSDWSNDHVIVHELVHYLQMTNQTPSNCSLDLEPAAYALQIEWQDQFDHPGERPDQFRLVMLNVGCSAL